jgi:hypothetical protein
VPGGEHLRGEGCAGGAELVEQGGGIVQRGQQRLGVAGGAGLRGVGGRGATPSWSGVTPNRWQSRRRYRALMPFSPRSHLATMSALTPACLSPRIHARESSLSAIHRVSTAVELGDLQVAVDLGPRVDASALPMERRIRHRIEIARAYSAWNRRDDALAILLDAEREAPEQIRHHFISRQLVVRWIRQQRGKPSHQLAGLAKRLHVA